MSFMGYKPYKIGRLIQKIKAWRTAISTTFIKASTKLYSSAFAALKPLVCF
jgi:hypothetical protein